MIDFKKEIKNIPVQYNIYSVFLDENWILSSPLIYLYTYITYNNSF